MAALVEQVEYLLDDIADVEWQLEKAQAKISKLEKQRDHLTKTVDEVLPELWRLYDFTAHATRGFALGASEGAIRKLDAAYIRVKQDLPIVD